MKVFVFGSNESGFHGAGAAAYAVKKYGAQIGIGFGPTGQAFAIPTKSWDILYSLTVEEIKHYVDRFFEYAKIRKDHEFVITQIGCGLAGFSPNVIAPLFKNAPMNCSFDTAWKPFLGEHRKYWGTF